LVITYQKTKEPAAFGELYLRYNQKVFLYCAKILGNRENAMDLTQDIFVKISDQLIRLKDPAAFVKWLFRIAYNDCMDVLTKNKKRQCAALDTIKEPEADLFDEENTILKDKEMEQMETAMTQLPEKDKSFLTEKYFEGKSVQDLMDKYELSKSAVKMRLARSREKLKLASVA
jgi:RNA polymerase sigma factor (sigma-70 family)